MTDNPQVSIIIVNFCGKNYLEKCLESLQKTSFENYEIIIVDNNSTDDSIDFIKKNYPKIRIIKLNKNYGFAIPNNMAAKTANGKYLVFLNNDTYVSQNWLGELVKPLEEDGTIALAQSLILHPDETVDSSGDYVDLLGNAFSRHDKPTKMRQILSPKGACMIARRDLFLDLGGFDETFFASLEDVDLGWRSWLWGYKVMIIPTSIIYHFGGQTIEQLSQTMAFHRVKNNILLRLTNFDFKDSFKSLTLMIFLTMSSKLFGRDFMKIPDQKLTIPDLKTLFKGFIWVIQNWNKVTTRKNFLNSRKTRSNKDLKKMGLITQISNP